MTCKCGCNTFYANQIIRVEIIVDGDGHFEDNRYATIEESIYDAEPPYGEFICTNCGEEYDTLED